MALAISNEDTQLLLNDKNVLQEHNLEKYRTAGQITETTLKFLVRLINNSYHFKKYSTPLSISELCSLSDSFMQTCINDVFANKVNEKGIAHPTTIDIDEISKGWAPELDDASNLTHWNKDHAMGKKRESVCQGRKSAVAGFLQEGDVVKITLGCHIDGYTSQVSHTLVIYPTITSEETQELVPAGPLLGPKADAIAATHIAVESVTSLLACALAPEKLPAAFPERQVTGSLIRLVVDTIAKTYNCALVPGSRVRRIRRFLAGQYEGVVAERNVKGVYWTESHQEAELLSASVEDKDVVKSKKGNGFTNDSAIATDDFSVLPGEVYLIDLQMAPLDGLPRGLITLQSVDQYSGKSHNQETLVARPSIICRDFAQQQVLKLKSSRQLLNKLDKSGVFPKKLSHLSNAFPLDIENPDWETISKELKPLRLGLSEITNNYLATVKSIQVCKLIPWDTILKAANPTGSHGIDANEQALPGHELPLPQLNISSLKLKALMKEAISVPVARKSITVVLCSSSITSSGKEELLKLNGGSCTRTSWVHSKYELNSSDKISQGIFQLAQLSKDKRFGLTIRETQPWKMKNMKDTVTPINPDMVME
ncbi:putative hydrolase Ecym_3508 [Eremothecium cymbalariae DBVPG|uniref:Probable metalloprotease ARX1 n=1 Tax=Eremothecium cymbalariae (strain CBS 270.75 / DBVPG 7215 / KCTC 17166 / NRRL Y-17582) TaxID=931890 RepID=G8JS67_ERECY|nr:Hypothetical protein Ecym_3508 [Eremothecium cymbalariae DBVPG\